MQIRRAAAARRRLLRDVHARALARQLTLKLGEAAEESLVRVDDRAATGGEGEGLRERRLALAHQKGEDERGGAGDAARAVDEDGASARLRVGDEVASLVKVLLDVGHGDVAHRAPEVPHSRLPHGCLERRGRVCQRGDRVGDAEMLLESRERDGVLDVAQVEESGQNARRVRGRPLARLGRAARRGQERASRRKRGKRLCEKEGPLGAGAAEGGRRGGGLLRVIRDQHHRAPRPRRALGRGEHAILAHDGMVRAADAALGEALDGTQIQDERRAAVRPVLAGL
mmetsp:Transcript_28745/g.92098  ORF Transcript_28745/g.92098 Transcript_28745/m.92098 type:complete len:284 (+) Transcript_28745:456-1307(+)